LPMRYIQVKTFFDSLQPPRVSKRARDEWIKKHLVSADERLARVVVVVVVVVVVYT
jgi:fumarate reductase subunit C